MRKVISSAVLAAAIAVGALFGTAGTASATPMPAVCNGIDKADSYVEYIIDSWALGVAVHADQTQQAKNIVDSVKVYCPWHLPGIRAAAASLSHSNA